MTWLSQPKLYDHQIHHSGLVEDDALSALLDRYPAELLDINAYSYDAEGQVSLATGERGRADGATLLEAITGGRVWVNLRDAHEAEVADEVLAIGGLPKDLGDEAGALAGVKATVKGHHARGVLPAVLQRAQTVDDRLAYRLVGEEADNSTHGGDVP
jgi:hypothetical protein